MKRRDDLQSDGTLLEWYMTRSHHPQLDNLTYTEFGMKCYIVHHDASKPLHWWEILEEHHHGRPQQHIRFYDVNHVSISRIQMVYPHHGDMFYLRLLLQHRRALSWEDIHTVDDIIYATHWDAARALGLLEDPQEGMLVFQEMLRYTVLPV